MSSLFPHLLMGCQKTPGYSQYVPEVPHCCHALSEPCMGSPRPGSCPRRGCPSLGHLWRTTWVSELPLPTPTSFSSLAQSWSWEANLHVGACFPGNPFCNKMKQDWPWVGNSWNWVKQNSKVLHKIPTPAVWSSALWIWWILLLWLGYSI